MIDFDDLLLSNKHIVAYDLDGTVFDFYSAMCKLLYERYGISLRKQDQKSHDMHETTGLPYPVLDGLVGEVLVNVKSIDSIPYSVEWIKTRYECTGCKPLFVTNRLPHFSWCTRELISKYFDIPYDVFFAAHSKVPIAEELGITHFFEDRVKRAVELSDAGIRVILIDQPWNRHAPDCSGISRTSWFEMVAGHHTF